MTEIPADTGIELREFGNTGLKVSALGFGAGHIGGADMREEEVATLLSAVLDSGITLIDTARGYGMSEERIGRHLSARRSDFVLSTKVGYSVPGYKDWTYDAVKAGIELACRTMNTDYLDIVHLHSCPAPTLTETGVVKALVEARDQGLLRAAAYSGENDDLRTAIDLGVFDSIQCSVNIFDQRSLTRYIPDATKAGMGVIGKRPLANAPWRFSARPVGNYALTYWERWRKSGLECPEDLDWPEFALRFAAYAPGVSSVIVGTSSLTHLAEHVANVSRRRLRDDQVLAATDNYRKHGSKWDGQV